MSKDSERKDQVYYARLTERILSDADARLRSNLIGQFTLITLLATCLLYLGGALFQIGFNLAVALPGFYEKDFYTLLIKGCILALFVAPPIVVARAFKRAISKSRNSNNTPAKRSKFWLILEKRMDRRKAIEAIIILSYLNYLICWAGYSLIAGIVSGFIVSSDVDSRCWLCRDFSTDDELIRGTLVGDNGTQVAILTNNSKIRFVEWEEVDFVRKVQRREGLPR